MRGSHVSALIIAKDEAANLGGCLESLSWADEIVVVVDAATQDGTLDIASERADRVAVRRFDSFARQRNYALSLATCGWVFAIDADERVTPELAAEIARATSEKDARFVGYRVPIRSTILGRPFVASGTQLDLPLRLFRRGYGRWDGQVHETVSIQGPVGRMKGHLDHSTIDDMHTFLQKMDAYTTLEAEWLREKGVRPRTFDLTARPVWTFLKLFLARGGFRDGREGFAFCALSGVSVAVRNWKLRERWRADVGEVMVGPTKVGVAPRDSIEAGR